MKLLESIKEIWKSNKREYFISGSIISLGCLFLYSVKKAPLEYTIPSGWLLSGVLMFTFGLLLWRDD